MNYDRYTKDPKLSALFNGNATSMGGNGEPDPGYPGFRAGGSGLVKSGGGGGCVKTGPFKEFVFLTRSTTHPSHPNRRLTSHHTATSSPSAPARQ